MIKGGSLKPDASKEGIQEGLTRTIIGWKVE